jgi:putative tryptophan/tyrosine transport system substrate-binding protein
MFFTTVFMNDVALERRQQMRTVFKMAFPCCALLLLLSSPCLASSNTKIVILETMPVPAVQEFIHHCTESLEELGYTEAKGTRIELLQANGDRNRASTLLEDSMRRSRPDIVISVATLATQAAHATLQGTGIPLFFGVVADPVGAGVVQEVGVPTGSTITGLLAALPREVQMRFAARLAQQVTGDRLPRIGVVTSDYPASLGDLRLIKEVAEARGELSIKEYVVPYREMPAGLEAMLEDAAKGFLALENEVDFWWEVSGPLGEVPEYVDLLFAKSSKPLLYGNTMRSVREGALFGMIQDVRQSAKEAAYLVRDILQGTDPGVIPIRPPDSFKVGVNLSTAITLGVAIPSDIMELAGEHVYR